MSNFLIIDTMNLMWRAAHVTRGDAFDRAGLAMHILFNSIPFTARKFKVDHLVFCFEGRSWRKDIDPFYKQNRKVKEAKLSSSEREFTDYLIEVLDDLKNFLVEKTNSSVLQHTCLEADDLVAGWIQKHPDSNHIILSTDTDFQQLIAKNVQIYNGVDKKIIRIDGVFDENGQPFKNSKGEIVPSIEPEYYLFEKIIRGDPSDNVRPAYPGARKNGTKNKIGIVEAFEDRINQGYAWNNFMNTIWTDENGNDKRVKDCYESNKLLIDLSDQPEVIKDVIAEVISDTQSKNKVMIGISFLKFCAKHQLTKLAEYPEKIVDLLGKPL